MYSMIIGMLIGAVVGLVLKTCKPGEGIRLVDYALLGLVAGLLVAFILGGIAGGPVYQYSLAYTIEIASFQGADHQVEGSFVLGNGQISTQSYYYFYRQGSRGGKVEDKVPAKGAEVIEDDSRPPSVMVYDCKDVGPTGSWLGFAFPRQKQDCDGYIDIIVPSGTIIDQKT